MAVASAGQVCISLQTDNHARTPPLSFFTGQMPFLPPNQQRQSTEGKFLCAVNWSKLIGGRNKHSRPANHCFCSCFARHCWMLWSFSTAAVHADAGCTSGCGGRRGMRDSCRQRPMMASLYAYRTPDISNTSCLSIRLRCNKFHV